jgi:glycosyltransferase involved in cell wall biosynthesis
MKKSQGRSKAPFLSVIVPVYKQEKIVVENIQQILDTLNETQYSFEIIPVVDGTSLDKSLQNLRKLRNKKIRPVGYVQNRGKGYAVRFGMKKARGEIITFIDGGMDIDPQGITMLLEHMKWYKADIIIGSKLHPASLVNYPFIRRIITYFYYMMVKVLFGLQVRDTQTGLKAYKQIVLKKVLPRLLVKQFAFDIEILAVANHLGYKKIFDAPVKVDLDWSASSIKLVGSNSAFLVLVDTLAIWYRLNILRYYDRQYKKNRTFDEVLNMFVNQP